MATALARRPPKRVTSNHQAACVSCCTPGPCRDPAAHKPQCIPPKQSTQISQTATKRRSWKFPRQRLLHICTTAYRNPPLPNAIHLHTTRRNAPPKPRPHKGESVNSQSYEHAKRCMNRARTVIVICGYYPFCVGYMTQQTPPTATKRSRHVSGPCLASGWVLWHWRRYRKQHSQYTQTSRESQPCKARPVRCAN